MYEKVTQVPFAISGYGTDKVPVWNGTQWVAQALVNAQIDAAAAIAQTKISFTAWGTYTTSWTSDGTQPDIVNGTKTCRYVQVGHVVFARIHLVMGSSTTFGTGNYFFSLPVAVANGDGGQAMGSGLVCDANGFRWPIVPDLADPSTIFLIIPAGGQVTNTVPFTWASTDTLSILMTYEVA